MNKTRWKCLKYQENAKLHSMRPASIYLKKKKQLWHILGVESGHDMSSMVDGAVYNFIGK